MSDKVIFQFENPFEKDSKVAYQKDAIMSVINLFKGVVNRDSGGVTTLRRSKTNLAEGDPIRNPQILSGRKLAENMHDVQLENNLFPDSDTKGNNFLIEMETGTGKTYVYLRTMLELYKEYGFKKFIVIVPSVAIREGVMKSIEQLVEHFKKVYDNLDISEYSFVYDSKTAVDTVSAKLVESNDLSIMITTMQSISGDNKRLKGGNADSRIAGEKKNAWEDIKYIKPIVIVDEPQKVIGSKKKSKGQEAIDEITPQFSLLYTATGDELVKNNRCSRIYSLSSYEAFEKGLVKQIEVKTVFGAVPKDYAYVRFLDVTPELKAKVEMFVNDQGSGHIIKRTVELIGGASLYNVSGKLKQYQNVFVHENPHKLKPLKVAFDGDVIEIPNGGSNYNFGDITITRKQIQLTIQSHLDRQFELLDSGDNIKVLSLFFIDSVVKVRDDKASDGTGRGEYFRMFDEEYNKIVAKPKYKAKFEEYSQFFLNYKDTNLVREGYFAQDKKTKTAMEINVDEAVEWDETKFVTKTQEAIDDAIDNILRGKDKLIKFDNSLAFIFSHSALREGWDNPNIFTLCTLKSGASEIAKKQEIGRGLRLSLTDSGVRMYDREINKLTVVVNDNYEHFAESMQADFNKKAGFNKDEITFEVLTQTLKKAGVPKKSITSELIETFKEELYNAGVITDKNILKKDAAKIKEVNFITPTLAEHQEMIVEKFVNIVRERGSHKIPVVNGDNEPIKNESHSRVNENEFAEIMKELGAKLSKRSYYQVKIDSESFINNVANTLNAEFGQNSITKNVDITIGNLGFDKAKKFELKGGVTETVRELDEDATVKNDYEIVNFIMYHTNLPRLAIIKILSKFTNREILNSQDILDKITERISQVFTAKKAEQIDCYKIIAGYNFDNKVIFESEHINVDDVDESKKKVVKTSRKAIHKYYNVDSQAEYEFAMHLENAENVILYTKLKRGGFTIDTPYGHYSPDWAIVVKQDNAAKLYFVIETKGDKSWEGLTDVEQAKINCAKKHFNLISDVTFEWVKDYSEFENKLTLKKE